jgi:DNA-binding GntR family transcriptional regulator
MQALQTVSVTDALVERLREQVLDGAFPAGATIGEIELANQVGVSRPTAKAAITTLVHDGLLRRNAHRSARVPMLSAEDVADVYRVRIMIELEVVRELAARAHVASGTEEVFAELGRLSDDVPTSRFIVADLHAHQCLVDQYGSPRTSRVYTSLRGEIHLCMIQSRRLMGRDRIAREHAAVLAAIAVGDIAGAVDAMRTHLTGACDKLAGAVPAAESARG